MAQDATKLIVSLEARLDSFEKQMKQAGVIADTAVKDVEERFNRANPGSTWATAIGTALGNLGGSVIRQALGLLEELAETLKKVQATAELTGQSLQSVFGNIKVLGGDAAAGMEKVATLLDRFGRGDVKNNALANLFDANNIDTKSVKDAAEAWNKVLDIIARAPNLVQAREIGSSLGISAEVVDRVRAFGDKLDEARSKAQASVPDLEKLAQAARLFDAAWKEAIESVKRYFVGNFAEMLQAISGFLGQVAGALKVLEKYNETARNFLHVDIGGQSVAGQAASQIEGVQKAIADFIQRAQTRAAGNAPPAGGPSSPASIVDKAQREQLSPFEREKRRVEETSDRLRLETALMGANTKERESSLEALRLEQMLYREGVTDLSQYRDRVAKLAETYGEAKAANDAARQSMQEFKELQQFTGQQLISFFDSITTGSATVEDALKNVARAIAQAALQAAILGQGPLAGLFGTSAAPGSANVGGLIGAAVGALPHFAGGGTIPAGQWAVTGERGPELIGPAPFPRAVIPNDIVAANNNSASGSTSYTHAPVYQITGTSPEQVIGMIRRYDEESYRKFTARAANARMRGF